MTKKEVASFNKQLNLRIEAVVAERDKLDDLIESITEMKDNYGVVIDYLECAVDSMRQLV
jgi:hypothetical protein